MAGSLCVVISTYNGERYLSQQLDSLIGQTAEIDRIHVRDDGSKDSTREVLRRYSAAFGNITFEVGENIGWRKGFPAALASCDGYDWYAFCDQDDFWDPRKLEVALSALDKINDSERPCLYAGNVAVADKDLVPLKAFNVAPVDIETRDLPHTLTRDEMAGGLTYVFNAKARDMLLRCPALGLTGHDRLLMLICKTYGLVTYDFDSYVLYRQHGENVYGGLAGGGVRGSRLKRLRDELGTDDMRSELASGLLALEASGSCSDSDKRFLSLCGSYKERFASRMRLLLTSNLGGASWKHTIKLRMKILLGTY